VAVVTTEIERASRDFLRTTDQLTTLVEMSDEQLRLAILLYEVEDETWTPEEREALQQQLDEVNALLLKKTESYCGLIRRLQSWSEYEDAEIKRLTARRDRKRKSVEWLKTRLLDHVRQQPNQRIETGAWTVSVALNPPRVEVLDAAAVPGEYTRTTITTDVDKKSILADFRATGAIPPGVEITRSERLALT
jgi:hypothetical protein